MYLDEKSYKNLRDSNPVLTAQREGRLKFFLNGSYKYTPSEKYKQMRVKLYPQDKLEKVIVKSLPKLDSIIKAFEVAESKGKKVTYISEGKIHISAK